MCPEKFVEKIKTHALYSVSFLQSRSVYKKTCRNIEKNRQATDKNMIRRMHISCWITNFTDTHSEYVIHIAFQLQQWLREWPSYYVLRTLPLLYTYFYYVFVWET